MRANKYGLPAILSLLLSLQIVHGEAQVQQIDFNIDHIATSDGLSQNDILDIFQDSYGFVWIATNDGLNRFDGEEFRLYQKGTLGLESSLVLDICEDRETNLWIATADRGLYYFLRNDNRFIHISQMSDDSRLATLETARYVTMGDGDEVWLYSRMAKSIIKVEYSPERQQVTGSTHFSIASLTYAQCCGLEFVDGDIYASTYWGLLRYSKRDKRLVRVEDFDYTIRDLERHGDNLYIATPVGLFCYHPKSGTKHKVLKGIDKLFRICWDDNDIYLATKDGLFRAQYSAAACDFSKPQQIDTYLNYNTNALERINTGGIWAGFDKEAIRIYQHNTKPFKLVNGFGNNHILPLFIGQDKNLWIGTEGSGYFVLDGEILSQTSKSNYMDERAINSIVYSDYTSKYYIATNGGIFEHGRSGAERMISSTSSTKYAVADGRYLWVACYSDGLIRIDLENNDIYNFTPNNSQLKSDIARCIIVGRGGNLWIATSKGLFTIEADDKASKRPTLIEMLPEVSGNHYISPLFESRSGDIWYGTLGSGLFRVISDQEGSYSVEEYNTSNLLPNNTIKAITEDHNGTIWVSLNSGLCAIDVDKQSSTSYDLNNGLQDSEFHDLSVLCTPNNTLMFGGVKGVTLFNPKNINVDYTQGTPYLTDLRIFNRSIREIKEGKKITPLALEATKAIRLKHNQNSFSFSFSSFNYTGTKKQQYLYKLKGFDREWQSVKQSSNSASYTNMSFGRYQFVVRCKNEDGLLNPTELVVDVTIDPPLWLTWYAILLYMVLTTIVLVSLIKYYQARLLRLNAVKLARMEKRKVEELLQDRTTFFTNVSHEFRTPLTLILSPLQQLMADQELISNKEWRDHLKTMAYNGESLLRLANDFLNFSKRESRALKLELQFGRLDLLLKQLSKHLMYMARNKGVTLDYSTSTSADIEFYFDAAHIEQIIYNLTSNAIKHTASGGKVTLSVKDSVDSVTLTVKDSGVGIPRDMQTRIFERFVSRDSSASNESSGIGIGLSLTKDLVELHNGEISFESEEGVGTTFVVVLPKYYGDDIPVDEPLSGNVQPARPKSATSHFERSVKAKAEAASDMERDVILVVDDNEQIVALLCTLFGSEYKVITAADGLEAFNLAQSYIPDIIISDVMMPLMDGYELCNNIKSSQSTSHIPVILLTAKSSTEDMATGYRYKADGYRIKPFNNDVLLEQVKSLLDNRRTLSNRIKQNETAFEVEQIGISSDADKQMVKRFVKFVEDNISNPDLLVSDVCSAVGLTQVVMNKKLKSLFNMTANSMIRSIRLKRAAELLRTGRYTVSSITYDVGFNDLRHFRESFLKEYGMFPQAYKKKYNEVAEGQEE
ncbi:MAG: ATP-binding protein [Rikenellaceae bacterium]